MEPITGVPQGQLLGPPSPPPHFSALPLRMEQRGGARQKGEFFISGDSVDILIFQCAINLTIIFILTVAF